MIDALRKGDRFKIYVMLCVTSGLCVACAVGPNFKPLHSHAPEKWLSANVTTGTAQVSVDTRALAQWWMEFNDAELNSLIERGIAANLDITLAVERVRQARAAIGQAAGPLLPSLDANGAYTRSYTILPKPKVTGPAIPGAPGFNRHIASDSYTAGFDAAWELDIFGGTRRGVEAARADELGQEEALRNTLVTVTAEIGTDYLNLRGEQEQLRIANDNLTLEQHSADISKRRHEAGFASGLDEANANAQVESTQALIPQLEAQVKQTIYALSLLLGKEPSDLLDELSKVQRLPRLPDTIPAGLPSEIVERRPDIRAAEAAAHAATARVGVQVAQFFPQFSLGGTAAWSASKLGDWSHNITSTYSGGPSVSWNLFNGFQTWFGLRSAQSVLRQALITYRQTVLNAFQEIESAWIAYDKEVESERSLRQSATDYHTALNLSTELYTAGTAEFLTVLDAERSLFSAQLSVIQSRVNAGNDLIALFKALGGGWQAADANGQAQPANDLPAPLQAHS